MPSKASRRTKAGLKAPKGKATRSGSAFKAKRKATNFGGLKGKFSGGPPPPFASQLPAQLAATSPDGLQGEKSFKGSEAGSNSRVVLACGALGVMAVLGIVAAVMVASGDGEGRSRAAIMPKHPKGKSEEEKKSRLREGMAKWHVASGDGKLNPSHDSYDYMIGNPEHHKNSAQKSETAKGSTPGKGKTGKLKDLAAARKRLVPAMAPKRGADSIRNVTLHE